MLTIRIATNTHPDPTESGDLCAKSGISGKRWFRVTTQWQCIKEAASSIQFTSGFSFRSDGVFIQCQLTSASYRERLVRSNRVGFVQ